MWMSTPTQMPDVVTDERISAYGRLVEAQRRLHRVFDRSLREGAGISIVWYEALLRIARSPGQNIPINELGEAMVLSSGGATRLVDRLEQQGYIERLACPTDRRVSWAHLTGAGRDVLDEATSIHLRDLDEHFVSKLSSSEMAELTEHLRQLRGDDFEV